MGLRTVAIHTWSWLNYKPIYADAQGMPSRRAFPEAQATWVPPEDEKRLAAYKLLAAYDQNQAGEMAAIIDGESARDRREFGDPSMYVDTLVAHVLGRDQTITVPGAEQDTPDGRAGDAAMAERVQGLLRDWSTSERLPMRLQQCERKSVLLGDGVYRLAWEPSRRRPTIRVTDPGFYFPVIGEDDDGGEFPTRVHFAWDLHADARRGLKARVRRITYELDWIRPATVAGVDEAGRAVRALAPPPDAPEGEEPPPVLTIGDLLNPETGGIARQYAWNDEPSYYTCYLTDATWELGDLRGPVDVDSLPLDKAVFATRSDGEVLDHLDLMIDFIPVIHQPNTVPSAEEHWGQSSIAKVLQVFDELAGTDTDSSKASATTGSPMVSFSGAGMSGTSLKVGPGVAHMLGEGGRMDVLDTSRQLAELRNHRGDLEDRASHVSRLPAVSLGTLDPSKVPSGFAMQISLGPLDSLIGGMRLAREHKEQLLLKFVQRLYLAGQHPDWAGVRVQDARLVRGPYIPTDKAAALEQVALGVEKGILSLETGIRMLIEVGFPITDAAREIEQIQSRQFEKAVALADATGDTAAVAAYLGIRLTPADPPPPNLPTGDLPDPDDETEDDEDEGLEGGDPASTNTRPQGNRGNPR